MVRVIFTFSLLISFFIGAGIMGFYAYPSSDSCDCTVTVGNQSMLVEDAFELMANNNNSFNPRYLSMINTTDMELNRDTKTTSYLYYRNKAVKTTKDSIELIDYKDVKGFIWKNQIIDRDIVLNDKSEGEFKTFIWKLSGENKDRYYTLKSVIGYLMHSFQSESKPKSIIFNDEMMSDDIPNGGSGKGLIHKAIGHIKSMLLKRAV